MSNSRVKSEAEYSMIRSNQENQSNDPNPFKATSNGNDYFDAITRRHKEEQQQYGNPFEPSHNMMPASNQMTQLNQMPSNQMPPPTPNNYMNEIPIENVSNIKQSIASNQSTGNVSDGLTSPFETVSFDPNANPNANPNFNANLNPNYNPNINPNINVHGYNNQPMYNNQQVYDNQQQVYENQQMYNTQPQPQPYNMPQNNPMNPQDMGQNNMQNMGPTADMQPSQMQEMPTMMPQNNPMNANYNNYGPDPNQQVNPNMTNPYGMPMQTNEQMTIAQQANQINDLINGINQGAIAPELRYEDSTGMGLMNNMGPYMNNNPGVDDIAIMDDIDKELEAMLHETDMNIDPDKGDFTSDNENLIEEIKRAEQSGHGSPRNNNPMNNQLNENAEEIQRKLNEIAQGNNTPPHGNEPKMQPDNAIDQMINELDSDGSSHKTDKNGKNLSDTLTLALDKNEVMQISKEKMLAEDLEDTKKKKSKIDILINIVLLIMILVVLGLVAKMILG